VRTETKTRPRSPSRRDFIKTTASSAALLAAQPHLYASGSDKIRVGLVGCGWRGAYDSGFCLRADENIELVAMADLFQDRLDEAIEKIKKNLEKEEQPPEKFNVSPDQCFLGFDAYKKVLACDVDLVIFTTPPHFRPEHLRAAIEAGKHAFIEKPVAVDPIGVRSVIASADLADSKNLTILAGTQMRRIAHIVAIMKKIHDGDIGPIQAAQCVRIGGGMLKWGQKEIPPHVSDMEWQLRRWLFVTWLSGDFIAEMHVHNLDLINWALQDAHPVSCIGVGGRQSRTGGEYGNVFDHFAVEYLYPNDVRVAYMGAQTEHATPRNDQRLVGTTGTAYFDFANAIIEGENPFKYEGPAPHPCLVQHTDQLNAIRNHIPLNEGKRIAYSTLTAIMGRISAYTGRAIKWDWVLNASKLDLSPEKYEFTDLPLEPAAIPGITKLI